MKVVKVLWVDSCNSNLNWTIAEDVEVEPMYIDSFGVVVKDTDEFLAIAQNYGNNPEQYSNITTIPKGCIKEVFVMHEDNVCKNEQNPVWSEDDEKVFRSLYNLIYVVRDCDCDSMKKKELSDWLKSLKDRVQLQLKWNEEDEESILEICNYLDRLVREDEDNQATRLIVQELKDWLKFLRPQKQQKPSDEQAK